MGQPKISVIIPTYNRACKLKRALLSVQQQSIKDFELIIVDDGSTDNTEEELNKLLPCYDFTVHYTKLDKNYGPSYARNRGVERATGKYVAFLDSDDYWEKDFLKHLSFFLDVHTDIGLVYCDTHLRNDRNNVLFTFSLAPYSYDKLLNSNGCIATGSLMFRKPLWYKCGGFREDMRRAEDFEWQLRMGEICNFERYPAVLHHYYRSSDGLIQMNNKNTALLRSSVEAVNNTKKMIKDRKIARSK